MLVGLLIEMESERFMKLPDEAKLYRCSSHPMTLRDEARLYRCASHPIKLPDETRLYRCASHPMQLPDKARLYRCASHPMELPDEARLYLCASHPTHQHRWENPRIFGHLKYEGTLCPADIKARINFYCKRCFLSQLLIIVHKC